MKKIFSILMVAFFVTALLSATAWGQTTYTWNQNSAAAFGTAANWTPTRTSPATNDVLVIDGNVTPMATITGLASQTIGQLTVINNAYATLTATSPATLTISGGPGTDFLIGAGSTLVDSASSVITISLPTTTTGIDSGTYRSRSTAGGAATAHQLIAADASAMTFVSGSICVQDTNSTGNIFGSGTANSVVFQAGSQFIQHAGSNPFQKSQPASVVVFNHGSWYRYCIASGTPSFSGRTYPNLEYNPVSGTAASTSGAAAVAIDTLVVTSDTLIFGVTGTPGHSIKGNISVAAGAILNFAPASAGTVNLNGSALQSISGTGTISTTANSTIAINNSNGISLGKNISILGTLAMMQGNIALGGNTLTLGASIAAPGTLTYTAGYITGTGTFTRWFATAAISGNAGLFPMGVGSNNRSLVIGGSPSTGGPIAVSYNDASTVSAITFTENVQSFVNRYDANWVVTPSGGYTDPAMTLTINGNGIPGITSVSDLDLSAATTIATGVWAAPSGSTSAPVLTRNGLTQGTIVTNPFYIASVGTSPLPVELTSFTALSGKNSVELAWNTATEINNYGFDVERANHSGLNGLRNWQKVGFVSGNGTSNVPHNYFFTDNSIAFGTYSYRLKQIDHDGNFEYSKELEATVASTPNTIVLGQNYPNPFNPQTSIEFAVPATGHTTLKVYNTLGEEIATLVNGNIEAGAVNHVSFNGSNFPSGIYFYTLRSGSFVDTKKMLMIK